MTVRLSDKAAEELFNQMLKNDFWIGVPTQDIREPGKPYQTFSFKPTSRGVVTRVTGVLDSPLEVSADVIFNHEDGLNRKQPIQILKKLTAKPGYDRSIGAWYNDYYQVLNASLFYVQFADRVYHRPLADDTVLIWFEGRALQDELATQTAEICKQQNFDPLLGVYEPTLVVGGYLLHRNPNNPEQTLLTFMTQSEFDSGALNWLTSLEIVMKTGAKGTFVTYNQLADQVEKETTAGTHSH